MLIHTPPVQQEYLPYGACLTARAPVYSSNCLACAYAQGPPPAWLPTPDSIADTNLAALMRDFQVRGEQVFPNRLGCIPFVCHRTAGRLPVPSGHKGLARACALSTSPGSCVKGAAPEVLWAQQHDNVRAGSVFLASDLQALLKLGG